MEKKIVTLDNLEYFYEKFKDQSSILIGTQTLTDEQKAQVRNNIGVAKFDAAGAAATAKEEAITQAKLDAAEVLKAYYTKTEVDNLLSTNSTGDRAYAKQYTDELFNSIQFAANSDIDALFTPKAE